MIACYYSFRPLLLYLYSSSFPAITLPGRSVAQPGSALHWGCRGREFESRRSDHFSLKFVVFSEAALPCASAYMNKHFTAEMVEALYDGLTEFPVDRNGLKLDMSQTLCQVDNYGCAINEVGPSETPIPQCSSIMKLQYQTYWDNASYQRSLLPPDDPLRALRLR